MNNLIVHENDIIALQFSNMDTEMDKRCKSVQQSLGSVFGPFFAVWPTLKDNLVHVYVVDHAWESLVKRCEFDPGAARKLIEQISGESISGYMKHGGCYLFGLCSPD